MSEMMTFPDTVDEFMEQYKITDTEQVYTNGCELVPIFRMKQWFESQPEPHWIPVTEKTLPDKNRVVVVCGEKGTWDYGTYRGHGDNIHFWHWKKNTYKRVYWWMYKEDALPEPYQPDAK